jgi:DNA-binding LacI/PurR family transcriptional regulator
MSPATELRREGFEEALRTRGLRPDRDLEVEGGFTVDGGREAAVALLGLSDPPTAIFCLSDEMAFGVIIAASAAGVAVPEALSVVGFGGHPVARAVNLTTIRQPIVAMTEEAVTGQ